MTFIQRLGSGLRYAFRGKQLATLVETWRDGQPAYSPVRFETLVKEGYRRNELIYACISKTANTAAQVQVQVLDVRDEPLETHPLLDLLRYPNPFMSEFDFWSAIIIYQKLAGVAYFEIIRSPLGLPVQLWPLRPDWVTPIASSKKMISGYEFKVPGVRVANLEPEDVLRFPLWDPMNQYHAWPPAAVAGRVGDIDNAATDYLKLFFEKGGTPPGILKTTQRLTDDQVTDIRARWRARYGGIQGWLDPAVLDMDATYQATGSSFKEMGFDTLDARNEARICAVMAVPPILVGAKIGLDRSTYSNYKEARSAWWEDDLLPMYANYQDVLDNQLTPMFGDDIRVTWDLTRVPALREEKTKQLEQSLAAFVANAITADEYRAEAGLGPTPGGDRLRPPSPTLTLGSGKIEPNGHTGKAAANAPDDDERRRHERIVKAAMGDFFEGQMKRTVKDARNGL